MRLFSRLLGFSLLIIATAVFSVPAQARPAPEGFADLAEKLSPAVVNISTSQKMNGGVSGGVPGMPPFALPPGQEFDPFREFFERFAEPFGEAMPEQEAHSLGSGFIIDRDGYVVTNHHVIADAEEITVILHDDTKLKAKIIGRDSKTDLALLKVESDTPLPFVRFGDSDAMRVGDWVLAIGNPFGLGGTVTAGIISARSRHINAGPFDDFLQTDAAINRGNSGGPMFNMDGEVVGINTAIFSPSGGNIGIGFAVPAALAQPVIKQLKEFGRTYRGWLGVKIQNVTEEIADSVGLDKPRGALVLEVTEDGPAAKSRLEVGDIILSFDGKPVDEMRELPRLVAETKVGKEVAVDIWRGGKRRTFEVTLGELEEESPQAETAQSGGDKNSQTSSEGESVMGMRIAPLTSALRDRLGVKDGAAGLVVLDVSRDGEAAKSGLRRGDLILRVGEEDVTTVKGFTQALSRLKKKGRNYALVRILRAGEGAFITLPTEEGK